MQDAAAEGDTEYLLTRAEALLAGTLALMTAHAQCDCADRRRVLEGRITGNLTQLAQQPTLRPQFRGALCNLRRHWQRLEERSGAAGEDLRLWTPGASFVQ